MSLSLKTSFFVKTYHMHITNKYPLVLAAIALLALCSCSSTGHVENKPSGSTTSKVPTEGQLGARKTDEKTDKSQPDYRIQGKDVLYITVYNEPELSYDQLTERSLRVSTDGRISFPLLGDIEAAGLTPFELEKKLVALLGDGYLIDPHVTVVVGSYHSSACVIGQVKKPGEIRLQDRDITVIEAISLSGGFTDIASPNRTYIVRMENGVKKIIQVKVNKIIKDKKGEDVILKPGDTLVIPEAFF